MDERGSGLFKKYLLSMPAPKNLSNTIRFTRYDPFNMAMKPYAWKKDENGKISLRKNVFGSYKARKSHSNPGVDMEPDYFSDSVKEDLIKLKEVYEKEIAECKKNEDYALGWMMNSMGNMVDNYRKRCELGLKLMTLDNKLEERERMIS